MKIEKMTMRTLAAVAAIVGFGSGAAMAADTADSKSDGLVEISVYRSAEPGYPAEESRITLRKGESYTVKEGSDVYFVSGVLLDENETSRVSTANVFDGESLTITADADGGEMTARTEWVSRKIEMKPISVRIDKKRISFSVAKESVKEDKTLLRTGQTMEWRPQEGRAENQTLTVKIDVKKAD